MCAIVNGTVQKLSHKILYFMYYWFLCDQIYRILHSG